MKVKFNNINVLGIASTVPKNIFNIEDLSEKFGTQEISKIIASTGVSQIRYADKEVTSSDLCLHSANKLIQNLGIDKNSIDGLIFVSQTPDFIMPQTSFILQNKLGLQENTICFDIPLGCTGYIQGLYQASLLVNSGSCKRVLLLSGDTTTKYIDDDDKSLRCLFGDGGSATILEQGSDEIYFNIKSDGSGSEQLIMNNNHGEKLMNSGNIKMDGFEVFSFVLKKVPSLIKETLIDIDKSAEQIDNFYFHQANSFINKYLNKSLKLTESQSPIVINGFGNTGPSSIPILISESFKDGLPKKNIILCGFGVGLSWGSCHCSLSNTKVYKTEIY